MAWADRQRDAGNTNPAGSALCSRSQGVIFHVSNDGLGFFGFAFGFWFGFFRLDLNIWNFSFHFPP